MLSTCTPRLAPASLLALLWVFFFGLTCLAPENALAAGQNTVFLPFKINAPNAAQLASQADKTLEQQVRAKGQRFVPRGTAEKLVNYGGAWPPPASSLAKIARDHGVRYIVVGSLNRLGTRISIDSAIYDTQSPQSPYSAFREADSLQGLGAITNETVNNMLGYSNRGSAIASINAEGNRRIDSGAILQKVSSKPGDLYDPETLSEDLKSVFSMGYFDSVEIDVAESPKGKEVIFRVTEKPMVSAVVVTGMDNIKEEDIKAAANIQPNTILNPVKVSQSIEQIKAMYKAKGYYATEVDAQIKTRDDGNTEVHYTINEGAKITVEKISFDGNETFSDDELIEQIQTSTYKWWLTWLTDAGVLKMDVLRQDAERISTFYHNNGFIEARVGEPVVEQRNDNLYVTFPLQEGPRYKVGSVDIQGDLLKPKEELISSLKIKDEKYLNRQVLRDDITRLTDLYAEQGYAFAEVTPRVTHSDSGDSIDVMLLVRQGTIAYFNRVEIQGNTRTRDNVIRRDIKVQEGGRFNSEAIRATTQRLNRLGYFEEVTVTPKPTMEEDQMDVVVSVKEKSTGQFSIGAGYSSSEDLLFMGEISENNLLGTGYRLSLAGGTSSDSTRYNLSFTNPRLLDSQVSAGADLFNWRHEYDDYTKDSNGITLRLGHPFWEEWRVYYSYTFSDTEITDVRPEASSVIHRAKDINLTSAVELSFVRDTRNKAFSPTSGSRNKLSVEYAGGILGGDAEFTKLEGSTSWYFPMVWNTVLNLRGAAGQAFENSDGKLPVYEHFYLGGMNSIRGFKSYDISPRDPEKGDKIGGDKMWFGSVSVIFPLVKDMGIDGEIFHDFGNVYDVDDNWDFSDYKKTAGIGILWASPLGPLRLAWGFNLDQKDNEDSSNWDFSMGGTF